MFCRLGGRTLPHILIVHLKRFIYNKYDRRRDSRLVDFPVVGLDMRPFVGSPLVGGDWVYDLYAVSVRLQMNGCACLFTCRRCSLIDGIVLTMMLCVSPAAQNHHGDLFGGHYTATVLHEDTGKWYMFDDSSVYEVHPVNASNTHHNSS